MKDGRVKRLSALHRIIYQATGGAIGRRLVANDMLLLTTTGRKSGRPHTVPLLYLTDGPGRYVVIASYGGRPHHPSWYLNLVADPRVTVQIRGRRFEAQATTAGEEERLRWWQKAVQAYHGYADYEARTDRPIPIVFLDAARPARSS